MTEVETEREETEVEREAAGTVETVEMEAAEMVVVAVGKVEEREVMAAAETEVVGGVTVVAMEEGWVKAKWKESHQVTRSLF